VIRFFVATTLLIAQGCQCQPGLPGDTKEQEAQTEEIDSVPPATGDTGPPKPCAIPELEPNDSIDIAQELPMERKACGDFEEPLDLDFWRFELPEDGWIGVRVDAVHLGSIADVHVIVTSDVGVNAGREDNEDNTDATLLFPALAGSYDILIADQAGNGAEERYHYELLATWDKEPVDWTERDLGTNTNAGAAQVVADGARVLGAVDDPTLIAEDWYVIDVPSGKHTLLVSVDAFRMGSPGDFSVFLYNEDLEALPLGCKDSCSSPGCVECEFAVGVVDQERDPIAEYDSPGNELVFIRIREADNRVGFAYWYAMDVSLEGS
jgi:hypothetical protein